MNPTISVKKLTKTYTYHKKQPGLWNSIKSLFYREKLYTTAVQEVNFDINQGEFVGFLGPNGAGKTTTLKMLSGILYPSSGDATVLGYTPWKRQKQFQKQFALIMGQKNQLWWDLPAMESFILNKEIYEIPDEQFKDTIEELTTLLDIKHLLHVQVRKLSLGERMKCELVAALLHNPKVLFLDEPTIGLDVISQQNIREFLKKYNKQNKTTIILTSHYMEDVQALCDRVIIINHGQKMYDGLLNDLIKKHIDHKVLTLTFTTPVTQASLKKFGTVVEYKKQHVVLHVPKDTAKLQAAAILTELPVEDITIDEPSIDEVIRTIFTTQAQPKNRGC
jgi:ABC-2 type transport system ATP-binding protein